MLTDIKNEHKSENVLGINGSHTAKDPRSLAGLHVERQKRVYFVFGETVFADLSSLSVLTLCEVFGVGDDEGLPVGEPAFTGEPLGEALGLGATLADAEGDGLATVGFTGSGFGDSHAPSTATLAAKTVDKMNDLLIVYSYG